MDIQSSNHSSNSQESGAQVVLDLERLIKSNIAAMDKGKAERKKLKEMLESALENDETYRIHNEKAKEAAKTKAQTKFQIMQQSANKTLIDKIKAITIEIREADAALSDYLREYERLSGSNEIETDDGVVREIVYVAKLVKKSSRAK
jgi:seryl-tRNA synthetase